MIKQYIVDAFAEEVFAGNPAAVCVLKRWLPVSTLQAIAAENNLPETAFVAPGEDGYQMRWFTPVAEIDLCGHATLATAFVIATFVDPQAGELVFHTRSGDLYASVKEREVSMSFPAFGLRKIPVTEAMVRAFRVVPRSAMLDRDLLLVLDSDEQVRSLDPDPGILKDLPGLCVAVTAAASADSPYDCVSRVFAPEMDVPEDPVTGSTHCMIVPYWARKLGKNEILAFQASERGGTLRCESRGDRVLIVGHAALYAVGNIYPSGYTPRSPEMIHVTLEPEGICAEMPRPKTAAQLLRSLDVAQETALVIRDGKLLTPDRHIWPGDRLMVRKVGSRG